MTNNEIPMTTTVPSMRRTLLTLLGGFAAFAVLTASYATADLADPAGTASAPIVMVD